jgi:putative transposase
VVWSFVYLAVRNLFALALLFACSDRSKELEILVLRHELAVLRRQSRRPRPVRADRALLATLSRVLPRPAWAAFSVRPETLLRWHRGLVARRWTYPQRHPGRPPLARPRQELIVRFARENPHWGYQRIAGELKRLGLAASPTTVRKVLAGAGIPPAPERGRQSWRSFLRQQAASTLACDFFTIETLGLQRIYVLFFLSLATRRLEYIACTPHLDNAWVSQQARNLTMQLNDEERRFRRLIHDRDTKFSRAFDDIFRSDGIEAIRTPMQAPNANANAERWVRTVRSDCLDRILVFGRRHLERVPRPYTKLYNEHRPHRALQLAAPDGGNSSQDNDTTAAVAVDRRDPPRRTHPRIPTSRVTALTHPTPALRGADQRSYHAVAPERSPASGSDHADREEEAAHGTGGPASVGCAWEPRQPGRSPTWPARSVRSRLPRP